MTTATIYTAGANETAMREVHKRLTAAISRRPASETERDAFRFEMQCLAEKYPNVFRAYSAWLCANGKD